MHSINFICYCSPRISQRVITPSLWLTQEPCGNITHISFIQFIVLSIHSINAVKFECRNHSIHIEAHAAESIDQVFVISVVPIDMHEMRFSRGNETWHLRGYVLGKIFPLLLCLSPEFLLPESFVCCSSTTLSSVFSGSSSVDDGPFPGDTLKLFRSSQ